MKVKTNFYTLTPCKNILLIEAKSSWDERVVTDLFKDVEAIVSKFYSNQLWAMLSDGRNWELATLQAAKLFPVFSGSEFLVGLTHHAIIVGESEMKQWVLKEKMIRLEKAFDSRIFSALEDARVWLKTNGYILESI